MESRETLILSTQPVTQGSGLIALDAAGYRAYSWERGITVPTKTIEGFFTSYVEIPRELAYALNVVFG